MSRRKIFAIVAGVIFSVWIYGTGLLIRPVISIFGDAMDWRERSLATRHGVNCGEIKVRHDARAATACVLKAQDEGRPFRVRYDLQGYDADVAGGLARTPGGQVFALSFDGDPLGMLGVSLSRQRVSQSPCPEPLHLYVNAKGRVNCFTSQLVQPRNIMSPNFEPY